MKKTIKQQIGIFVLFSLTAVLFQSCNTMYVPTMQNVPLLQEKNEVRATLGLSNLQGAYAVTDNIGVIANGYYSNVTSVFDQNSIVYSYTTERNIFHIEAGGGYFKKLSDNAIFECYGGLGFGNSSFKKFDSDSLSALPVLKSTFFTKTARFFVQPSIGYTIDNFDVAFSTRFIVQNYYGVDTSGFTKIDLYDNKLLNIDQPFLFMEPAITLRFGYKYLKFHAQAIFSYKYNVDRLNYMPFVFNVGIHVNIADRLMPKKQKVTAPSYEED